jgi:Peptidase family S41/PDZ domain
MHKWIGGIFLLFVAGLCPAQMTLNQKLLDFQQLAGLYDKQYGLYEWKRDAIHFDFLKTAPWLDRVRQSATDLDFYEICVEYVGSLQDAHDSFTFPSGFSATLGFTVDLYDGSPLIDSINRSQLPTSRFPFQIGDELVSVDGVGAEDLIQKFLKYAVAANPRSARRSAAGRITTRSQASMPHAHEIGESAAVVIRRQSGSLDSYTIPWNKSGVPVLQVGPVPSLSAATRRKAENIEGLPVPDYLRPLLELQNDSVPAETYTNILNFGGFSPIFTLPDGFVQRLGRGLQDNFFSGTIPIAGKTVGFIRIPSFSPRTSTAVAEQQLSDEILYFQAHTDGLIVDEMRNPGGIISWQNTVCRYLIPYPFRVTGWSMRATASRLQSFANNLNQAKLNGAPQNIIDLYQSLLDQIQVAYNENRGMTGPVPLDGSSLDRQPATDASGAILAYTKPLIVLVDEFSVSGGDQFASILQDAGRGQIVGIRTMGAGGTNGSFPATDYSEGTAGITFGIAVRAQPIITPDFGVTQYTENVGVRPDIEIDYMTKDNLLNRGRPFFTSVTGVIADWIDKNSQ